MMGPVIRVWTALRDDVWYLADPGEVDEGECADRAGNGTVLGFDRGLHNGQMYPFGTTRMLTGY